MNISHFKILFDVELFKVIFAELCIEINISKVHIIKIYMLSNKKKSKIYVIKMEIKLNIDLLIQKQVFYNF